MFRALIPIVGILIAVGLFFTYVQPTYREVQAVRAETAQYAEAITHALELQRRVSELKTRQNSISLADLERLEALLPDEIDEVAFLVDLNALVGKHTLGLGDILVVDSEDVESTNAPRSRRGSTEEEEVLQPAEGGVDTAARGKYRTLDVHFAVVGTYQDFRTFLSDLERSLVLMDVTDISFGQDDAAETTYSVSVRLYSLNAPTS